MMIELYRIKNNHIGLFFGYGLYINGDSWSNTFSFIRWI